MKKKFNLDSPDGDIYYWHHIDSEKINYSKRVQGGGSVMIWICFCSFGKTPIALISTSMKSSFYVQLLNQYLIPFGSSILNENYTFQQDNALCHRAKNIQEWVEEK